MRWWMWCEAIIDFCQCQLTFCSKYINCFRLNSISCNLIVTKCVKPTGKNNCHRWCSIGRIWHAGLLGEWLSVDWNRFLKSDLFANAALKLVIRQLNEFSSSINFDDTCSEVYFSLWFGWHCLTSIPVLLALHLGAPFWSSQILETVVQLQCALLSGTVSDSKLDWWWQIEGKEMGPGNANRHLEESFVCCLNNGPSQSNTVLYCMKFWWLGLIVLTFKMSPPHSRTPRSTKLERTYPIGFKHNNNQQPSEFILVC